MTIRSESELIWGQTKKVLYAVFTLPYHLIEVLIHPHKLGHKVGHIREWFKEFHEWFMESKVTSWLVIINVAVFLISIAFFTENIWDVTVLYPEAFFAGNYGAVITSAFLHADIWHLLGNMLVLLIMGRVVEKEFGRWPMLIIYFGSMIMSGVAAAYYYLFIVGVNVGAVGASGAIAGVTAAAILVRPFYFTYLMFGIPVPIALVGWLFIVQDSLAMLNPVEGDSVGHIAHLAGYTGIFILVWLLSRENKKKMFAGLIVNVLLVMLTLLVYYLVPGLGWNL